MTQWVVRSHTKGIGTFQEPETNLGTVCVQDSVGHNYSLLLLQTLAYKTLPSNISVNNLKKKCNFLFWGLLPF